MRMPVNAGTTCEEVLQCLLGSSVARNVVAKKHGQPDCWIHEWEPVIGLQGRVYALLTPEGDLYQHP